MPPLSELVKLKLELSRKARRQGDFKTAESELREALAVHPHHAVLHEALGQLYLSAGRVSEAAEIADALLEMHPGSSGPIQLKGLVLLRQNHAEEALAMFLEVERQRPSAFLASQIVKALVRAKSYGEAIRRAQEALQKDPNDTYILGSLEAAYARSGEHEKAAEICERLLALKPRDARAIRDLIKNRLAELPDDEAEEELAALLRIPSYARNPELHKLAAERLFKRGKFDLAAGAYGEALALEPRDRHCLKQRGFALYRAGCYEEAAEILEPFFQEEPLDHFVRSSLVACWQRLGHAGELDAAFDRALANHPDKPQLHGIRKKALRHMEKS